MNLKDQSNFNVDLLDNKHASDFSLTSHNHSSISGNAATASKWATARTISLTGGVTGSASIDGSANVSVSATVANVSSAATENKIVQRDSAGDVHCRLLRPNYQNQTSISGAIAYRVNNSTDNYLRFCSDPAAIRTWLGAAPASHTHDLLKGIYTGNGGYQKPTYFSASLRLQMMNGLPGTSGGYHDCLWCGSYISDVPICNMLAMSKDGSGKMYLFSQNANTDTWVNKGTIYHTGNKPTASDIGALPLSGGTLSGNLIGNSSIAARAKIESPVINFDRYSRYENHNFSAGGGAGICNDDGTYKCLMLLGNSSGGGYRKVEVWDDLHVNGKASADSYTCRGADIVSSGTNTNGMYIKYYNGILECYKSVAITTDLTATWGNIYASGYKDLGGWAYNFTGTPYVQISINNVGGGSSGIPGSVLGTTKNAIGSVEIYRGGWITGATFWIQIKGTGYWK